MTKGYRHKQFIARIELNTYTRLRKQFKPLNSNESAASYFRRLAIELEIHDYFIEPKGGK